MAFLVELSGDFMTVSNALVSASTLRDLVGNVSIAVLICVLARASNGNISCRVWSQLLATVVKATAIRFKSCLTEGGEMRTKVLFVVFERDRHFFGCTLKMRFQDEVVSEIDGERDGD